MISFPLILKKYDVISIAVNLNSRFAKFVAPTRGPCRARITPFSISEKEEEEAEGKKEERRKE